MQFLRCDTTEQSLVLALHTDRMAQVIYWGACLPANMYLNQIVTAIASDIPKCPTPISVLPVDGESFTGMAGLSIRNDNGEILYPKFAFSKVHQQGNTNHIIYTDSTLGLSYTMDITTYTDTNVMAVSAHLHSTNKVAVDWFSAPVLPAPANADEIIDFSGRWCAEMQPQSVPWTTGMRTRESRLGRSSHEHYPAVILPTHGATEHTGGVYGLHYGWSGGHRMIAEHLQNGYRQVQFGHATGSYSRVDTDFKTAPLYITYTDKGTNGMSQAFHKLVRHHFMGDTFINTPRPVNYNCWEAVYFDHNVPQLQQIASKAHAIGAERFVLDDGWFGTRNNDFSSLGDWDVNTDKFPDGLTPLINHVNNLGMQFGIWLEPEMVSPDSNLNRTHPEWVLGTQDQVTVRQQWVLNMGLPEVQQYLYEKIAHLLTHNNITYIKWDHNRIVPQVHTAQTEGTYALLRRLNQDFPHVEIESCCSGGGRMDYGILSYTKRVWLSDCNDAYERLIMQYNASLWLPRDIVGSHVGPRVSHTTARHIPMHFRAWVSASRHMGFEMDPNELTVDEAEILTSVVQWYKDNRTWLCNGTTYRLPVQQHAIYPEMTVSTDGTQFVAFVGQFKMLESIAPQPLKFVGLDANATYEIQLINKHHLPWAAARGNSTALHQESVTLSGAVLMQVGMALPVADPGTMMVIQGVRV